jgi:hypothetical protein
MAHSHARTPRRRLLAWAPVVAAVLLATPSEARGRLTFTDATGDANGVNGQQFFDSSVPSAATGPASSSAADVVSVTLEDLVVNKRVVGLRGVLTLAAAPAEGVMYRLKSSTDKCNSLWFEHRRWLGAPAQNLVRSACGAPEVLNDIVVTTVGNTLVFEALFAKMPREARAGVTMTAISGSTTALVGNADLFVSVPQYDVAMTDQTFRLG